MKKKTLKILAGCLAAILLLGGCGKKEVPEETEPEQIILFPDAADYPRVDGSTACLPLMAQVMADTCEVPLEDVQSQVYASKTATAWRNLVTKEADLLLVYEMPEQVQQWWEEAYPGIKLDVSPIGRDALVFLVNGLNPVETLSQQELINIYAGRITNWSHVGGDDLPIVAFQRDETSGSQTLFKKLLMQGKEPMEAPANLRPGDMGELVERIADYNNTANALGYSVYYYVSQMKSISGLRMIAVDGVAPTDATISTGSYPLTNDFYVAIRSDEPEDSPARQLYNWLCGTEGVRALQASGYVPVK